MGALFEILYIPPEEAVEPEAPEAPSRILKTEHAPTGDYQYICERAEPDGSFTYFQQGLTIPGPGDRMFRGLREGQCSCCYYRRREILEWTTSGPGCLALMTPGWYQDPDGSWKWWHGDCPHGHPGFSCKKNYEDEWEKLEDLPADEKNLEALLADENLEAQDLDEENL